ncbi:MAG TPA: hypothetical protein VGF38_19190 [Ktedonobacterales bacterium]|jgi:hypothetical protein
MPMDPTNPPTQRSAPFRQGEAKSSGGNDSGLKIENMLLEEFNYASTTAYQAMEDRARMFNMYLLVVGILGSAFGAIYPLGGARSSFIQPIAAVVLFAAGIAGIAFFVLLIRLRQAFRQSLITMSVIKEFYIREFQEQMPTIQHAFRWRLSGIPAGERAGSATFIVCHMVGFIGALCFAGCVFMGDELLRANVPNTRIAAFGVWQSLLLGFVAFLIVMVWMVGYYRRSLNAKDEQKMLDAAEREVDKM